MTSCCGCIFGRAERSVATIGGGESCCSEDELTDEAESLRLLRLDSEGAGVAGGVSMGGVGWSLKEATEVEGTAATMTKYCV